MKKRLLCLILAAVAALGLLSGCGGEPVDDNSSAGSSLPVEESSAPAESEPEPTPVVNPFTGEEGYDEALLTRRPVAVMFNNIKQALPQKGISSADIIYEMQVEGSITRLMGVFHDYKSLPDLGSVRSARPDFIELLLPLDAIYVHFGQSTQAKDAIAKYKVSSVNGIHLVKKAFYFDEERAKSRSSEHCWFTNAELVQAGIAAEKYETSTKDPIQPVFNFVRPAEEAMPASSRAAASLTVPLSGSVTASFDYDESTKTYAKSQFGQPHIDSNTGEAAKVTNVFVMYTSVDMMSDGKHRDIGLETGSGYYMSHGKLTEVTFKKAGPTESMQVLDADGNAVKVNPGKTWFCFAPTDAKGKTVVQPGDAS